SESLLSLQPSSFILPPLSFSDCRRSLEFIPILCEVVPSGAPNQQVVWKPVSPAAFPVEDPIGYLSSFHRPRPPPSRSKQYPDVYLDRDGNWVWSAVPRPKVLSRGIRDPCRIRSLELDGAISSGWQA